jgi:carboxymethylenebutenolidase
MGFFPREVAPAGNLLESFFEANGAVRRKTMIERPVQIKTADGIADGYIYEHDEGGWWPGVIYYTDILGIRSANREIAKRIASNGYTVLFPNVFYRNAKPPIFDAPPNFTEERSRQRLLELTGPLTPEAMERDAESYIDFLAAQESVGGEPFGVIGTCFTGAMALRTAAARPEKIAAVASFHGGRLVTDAPTSPHRILSRVKAQLFFAHATNDQTIPAEAIAELDEALAAWGGKYESRVFGATHGWTVPGSPVYNEREAEAAFSTMTALFAAKLKDPTGRSVASS